MTGDTGGTRPVVVLVGPPGAGKTTVGRLVAEGLGVGFRDTDADVAALAGKPVPDIFLDDGEARFRELEEQAVHAALGSHGGVLALGGGAVLSALTRRRLSGQPVVFLSVEVADAARRVGLNRDRPLLLGNVRQQLRALLDARDPLYREVAGRIVRTDGRSVQDVAAEVMGGLARPDAASTDAARAQSNSPEAG